MRKIQDDFFMRFLCSYVKSGRIYANTRRDERFR